eukprot:Hpha_TRINITY_DN12909_c0_g1::TRINITY_DN12909_c0_g1_i3::g.164773::m.164773
MVSVPERDLEGRVMVRVSETVEEGNDTVTEEVWEVLAVAETEPVMVREVEGRVSVTVPVLVTVGREKVRVTVVECVGSVIVCETEEVPVGRVNVEVDVIVRV